MKNQSNPKKSNSSNAEEFIEKNYPSFFKLLIIGIILIIACSYFTRNLNSPWANSLINSTIFIVALLFALIREKNIFLKKISAERLKMDLLPASLQIIEKQVRTGINSSESATIYAIDKLTHIQTLNAALLQEASDALNHTREIAHAMKNFTEEGQNALNIFVEQQQLLAKLQSQKDAQVTQAMGDITQLIGPLVDVIRNIAQQTRLLSFNAAIEAARAGKDGSGFKIVATAVRELSMQTTDAAKKIEDGIATIQKAAHINSISYSKEISETLQGMQHIHALISNNIENSNSIFPYLQELSQSMDHGTTQIRDHVVDVLGKMQFQDILRQILEQVENSLNALSAYSQANLRGEMPQAELATLLQQWQTSYVLLEQRLAHADTLHETDAASLKESGGPKIDLF